MRILSFCCLLVSCGATVNTNWTPYSATTPQNQIVPIAVVAYPPDIEAIVKAGGKVHGAFSAAGDDDASLSDVELSVRKEAASRGATHIAPTKAGYGEITFQTPGTATTTVIGNTALTRVHPAGETSVSYPKRSYTSWRVEVVDWHRLPEGLKPKH